MSGNKSSKNSEKEEEVFKGLMVASKRKKTSVLLKEVKKSACLLLQ